MNTNQECADRARRLADTADRIADAMMGDTTIDGEDPLEFLDGWVLEVQGEFDDNEWAVVLEAGGPHSHIDNRGTVHVRSASAEGDARSAGSERVADHFHAITDERRGERLGWTP